MSDWLTNSGYLLDALDGVWRRAEFSGIPYSDGDEFEQRMERNLREVSDKSLFSPEIADTIVDWPSYYHVSCIRANILRPFEERLRSSDVLEVGAGCGAITRFLGEGGANVCALEGSPRRARIARLRTSDLTNITVVSDNFETFEVGKKFDIVTFIGVLEYANQFLQGERPARVMLERARSMLKPGGIVIIAIENQLGLKYFAGAPEDHVSRRMFGIEDRYSADGVRTYGREELLKLVQGAGFGQVRFYAPFPDYKFPVTIFSEEGLKSPDFEATSILNSSVFSDRQLTNYLAFDLPRVWEVIIRNKLGMDLANSFLVVASDESLKKSSPLAWHFSSGRASRFCKVLSFQRNEAGEIRISGRLLNEPIGAPDEQGMQIELSSDTPYAQGTPLAAELRSRLTIDGWTIEQAAQCIERFLRIAEELMRREGVTVSLSSANNVIPGRFVDLIPQNIILSDSGDSHLIDREWVYEGTVSAAWLVFRAFSSLFSSLPVTGKSGSEFISTRLGFMTALYKALGFGCSEDEVLELGRKEAFLQSLVSGRTVPGDSWGPNEPLWSKNRQDRESLYNFHDIVDRYIELKQEVLAQRAILEEAQRELGSLRKKPQNGELETLARVTDLETERDSARKINVTLEKHCSTLEKQVGDSEQHVAGLVKASDRKGIKGFLRLLRKLKVAFIGG